MEQPQPMSLTEMEDRLGANFYELDYELNMVQKDIDEKAANVLELVVTSGDDWLAYYLTDNEHLHKRKGGGIPDTDRINNALEKIYSMSPHEQGVVLECARSYIRFKFGYED